MIAMELVADRATKEPLDKATGNRIVEECYRNGVVILKAGTYDNVIRLLPPLTIEEGLLEEALGVLDDAMGTALAAEGRSGGRPAVASVGRTVAPEGSPGPAEGRFRMQDTPKPLTPKRSRRRSGASGPVGEDRSHAIDVSRSASRETTGCLVRAGRRSPVTSSRSSRPSSSSTT